MRVPDCLQTMSAMTENASRSRRATAAPLGLVDAPIVAGDETGETAIVRKTAAELAQLYALALVRTVPFGARPSGDEDDAPGLGVLHGAASGGRVHQLANIWSWAAPYRPVANRGDLRRPGDTAPLSAWVRYLRDRHGAALALTDHESGQPPRDPLALARMIHDEGPARPILVLALAACARGARPRGGRTPRGALSGLARVAEEMPARRPDRPRPNRPGLLAGQISLLAAGEPQSALPGGGHRAGAVLEALRRDYPGLLSSIAEHNATAPLSGTVAGLDAAACAGWAPVAIERNYRIPALPILRPNLHPAGGERSVYRAAFLAAVARQTIAFSPEEHAELDRIVGDVALGVAVLGGSWPSELTAETLRGTAEGAAFQQGEPRPKRSWLGWRRRYSS
ncbi:hypothetical protein SAMN05444413_11613 [Roseivivax marinus]|uniref:hypothetical protein n=1 Tax=Roseivivax marinus TaxID=1379903 RepID=UPI0008BA7DFF|nr:hypothetical protein [Roseivivax marinus]SEL77497.1 hypothetical protein SAMN05444413_11613 [Roseivivax marinus]